MRTADCAIFTMLLEIEAAARGARGATERLRTHDRVHGTELV
jgi:hypothetical protein